MLRVGGVKLAWVLASVLAALPITATTATADIGVVGVTPKIARPGDQVELKVGCGRCPGDASFPISLVPSAKAPQPDRCRANAICSPAAARPPDKRPAVLLGTTRAEPLSEATSRLDLTFAVPRIEPGVYAFVIFCASCVRGPSGSLIADTAPGSLLRVLPSAPESSSDGGTDATWWIVAGIATVALMLAAILLLRRQRTA
jgi:hypothetical protein